MRRCGSTAALAIAALAACGDEPEPVDLRFHTPLATITTLFETFGIEDMSQSDVRRIMGERKRFHLNDPDTYRACFSDYSGPQDEGLAGFVFGALAAAKDDLRFTMDADMARVFPTSEETAGRMVVLRRGESGWKIVLRESVPHEIQRQLHAVYQRAHTDALQHGAPL